MTSGAKTRTVKTLIAGVLLFGILQFVGDFSVRQSAVLSAIGALVFLLVLTLQTPRFVPYHIFVQPIMPSILTDFELVVDTEEARSELWRKVAKLPQAPSNIWNSGFSVSFITPELIYKSGWNSFASRLDMYATLQPAGGIFYPDRLAADESGEFPYLLPVSVDLRLKRGGRSILPGYSLSIELPIEHWEKVRHNEALKGIQDALTNHLCGTVEVELAFIPDDEFAVHQTHFAATGRDFERAYATAIRDRAGLRAAFGWKGIPQRTHHWEVEISADRSNQIEHKYLRVSHSAL